LKGVDNFVLPNDTVPSAMHDIALTINNTEMANLSVNTGAVAGAFTPTVFNAAAVLGQLSKLTANVNYSSLSNSGATVVESLPVTFDITANADGSLNTVVVAGAAGSIKSVDTGLVNLATSITWQNVGSVYSALGGTALAGRDLAVDKFQFVSSVVNSSPTNITNFDAVANTGVDVADILDFTAYLGAASGGITAALTANPVTTALTTGKVYTLVDIAGNQDITTAAGLATALAAGGEYASLDSVASGKNVILTAATAGSTTYQAFYVTPATNAGTALTETFTVTLVGTITSSDAFSTLVSGNFA
jgi:hypothetical protein